METKNTFQIISKDNKVKTISDLWFILRAVTYIRAESFDTCPILYIRYNIHEMSILCLKLVWLIKLRDIF
jgi:hypothetical protein